MQPNGSVLISGQRPFGKSGRRDPFAQHGVAYPDWAATGSNSGKFLFAFGWTLVDGNYWIYTTGELTTFEIASAWEVIMTSFRSPDGLVAWKGEAYNYDVRWTATRKWTLAEFQDYMANN
jgi:hypothetical protein